jgi:hypothetical protein
MNTLLIKYGRTDERAVCVTGKTEHLFITACTLVQCSVMDDSAFLWEHATFAPSPHRNPLTDRYEILHN